jgi:hypothetical protein
MLRVILQQRRYEKGNLNKSGLGEKKKLVFFNLYRQTWKKDDETRTPY